MEVEVLFEKKYATYMYSFTVKSVATLILVISKSNAFLKRGVCSDINIIITMIKRVDATRLAYQLPSM